MRKVNSEQLEEESWASPKGAFADSKKWSLPLPERHIVRAEARDYCDGEE